MIADNEQMRNPLVQQKTESNYCPLDISTSKITNGTWYWSVSTVDFEGNISERAASRSFVAVDGEIIQKLVYPPDNYEIATNLLSDLRFTWKSNLPFETRLQISRTDNFKSKVYDQKESDTFDSGINIPTGHYYWRIISIDADGKEFSTLPRLINVMAMLPAPELIIPTEEKKAYVRPETLYIFRWKKVSGADYYNFTLSADSSKDELLHLTLLENNELAVNMENYPNGKYHWTVQAFANERPLASRRSGRLSETDFEMKKIIPIKLLWPVNNDKIDGIAAIENPSSVTWESVDELTSSTFVLRRASDGRIVNSTKNPEKEIKLPRLMSGSYTWTVNGISTDDIDISPSKIGTFTVLPVPPLDDVMTDQPERGQIFNGYYFLGTKKISFAWEPIEKATEYEIKIFGPDKKKIFETTTRETSFDLTDMSKLKRGTFTWTVKARRLLTDGTLLQESGITEENFEIDLPHLKTTSLKEGIYYGR